MPLERISRLEVSIVPPLSDEDVRQLHVGDRLRISGVIYTARDAAHRRMSDTLARGGKLPIDVKGQLLYYVGPTPPRPGRVVGAVGPTTAMRMDEFTPRLLKAGLKATMGKGNRGSRVRKALEEYVAVYFMAVGGAGAMLSRFVKSVAEVAYQDLGTESIKRIEVQDFPAVVMDDCYGHDLLMEGREQWRDPSKLGSYKASKRIVIAGGG